MTNFWREVAETVYLHRTHCGEKYRFGVIEAAAAAGEKHERSMPLYQRVFARERAAEAVAKMFEAYRISINPNWDGSIA